MVKNIKFKKSILVKVLALSIIGYSGYQAFQLHKNNEIKRVKGYLEDFLTEDNYVDLSKISSDYNITNFSGETLSDVLKDSDIDYVRLTDSYVYNGSHVTSFKQKSAINYNNLIGTLDNGESVYEGYEPIRNSIDGNVTYDIPNEYTLEDIYVNAEPVRYNELENMEINVIENNYEDSYSLVLERK